MGAPTTFLEKTQSTQNTDYMPERYGVSGNHYQSQRNSKEIKKADYDTGQKMGVRSKTSQN